MKIRLHIPGIPYSITREEYTDCAFTGKVLRFGPMMQSRGFEVYHYGVATSSCHGFTKHIDLLDVAEWTELRVKTFQFLDNQLTFEEACAKNADPMVISNTLSNWNSPLTVEFNRRFKTHLQAHYRGKATDLVCIPLGRTYDTALEGGDYVVIETGIGYGNSCKDFRIFESHTVLAASLEDKNCVPNYWFVIPNYYQLTDFTPVLAPETQRIGFLGRVSSTKGCHIVVEVSKRFPDVTFVLCGPGHPEAFVGGNVVHLAPVHGKERSDYLGSLAAILCPSQYLEPFCGVSVEAQLCGTPVLSADHGAFAYNVEHRKTGLRCHTLADYCYGVQLALDGGFDRRYIAETSRAKFDMYTLAHDYEYALKTVLDVHNGKRGWYAATSRYAPRQRMYLVIPYFGRFPNYFQLYLDSLQQNADVLTVIMPTDLDLSGYRVPANLVPIPMSLDDIRRRLAAFLLEFYDHRVDPSALLHQVYKLVDIKVTYPLLFADLLTEPQRHDLVGWGDIDVIYGKLSRFFQEDHDAYDMAGGWHGHFTAIGNTDEFKRLFLQIPDYLKLVLDNNRVYIADEIQYRAPLETYVKDKTICYLNATFCDIVPPCFFHLFPQRSNTDFFNNKDPEKGLRQLFYNALDGSLTTTYQDGTSYETSYCHLQKRAMAMPFTEVFNGYYILEDRFAFSSADIPMQIFQTWSSSSMPARMCACVDLLRKQNPEFSHQFFDDAGQRQFLEMHFEADVVAAYDALVPGAYKADLWRYCILYIRGGLYLDIKLYCADDFRLLHLYDGVSNNNWCNDGEMSIYNGLLMSPARNPILWTCIQRIVQHVRDQYYGTDPWAITGPRLLGEVVGRQGTEMMRLVHRGPISDELIYFGSKVCLRHYAGYREDVGMSGYYRRLWERREVYQCIDEIIYTVQPKIRPNLFQTWETHELPAKMRSCVEALKRHNPELTHRLFDNRECREFIRDHFPQSVLTAYDTLLPGAFKADLWRLCVLFIHGGIYLDIKYQPVAGFKLVTLLDKERFCLAPNPNPSLQGVYNAMMVCRAQSPVLQKCIDQIVDNVHRRFYGSILWDITGPTMMRPLVPPDLLEDLRHEPECIQFCGQTILTMYPGYYLEDVPLYRLKNNQEPYSTLWDQRRVFDSSARVVLLLTSTVQVGPRISWLHETSKDERLQTYLRSVNKWLSETTLPVVLVENSGYDFGLPETERFEVISFDETGLLPHNTSKGRSEVLAIDYAYRNSRLLREATFVVKLTGRFFVPGLETYLRGLPLDDINCLTQNDPSRCEMVGAHARAFSRIFDVEITDFVEDDYRKRSAAETTCWRCREFSIESTVRGGDPRPYSTI